MHNRFVHIFHVSVSRWTVSQLLITFLRSEKSMHTWSYLVQLFLWSFSGNKNSKLSENSSEERNKLSWLPQILCWRRLLSEDFCCLCVPSLSLCWTCWDMPAPCPFAQPGGCTFYCIHSQNVTYRKLQKLQNVTWGNCKKESEYTCERMCQKWSSIFLSSQRWWEKNLAGFINWICILKWEVRLVWFMFYVN